MRAPRRVDEDLEVGAGLRLADELGQHLRPERRIRRIVVTEFGGDDAAHGAAILLAVAASRGSRRTSRRSVETMLAMKSCTSSGDDSVDGPDPHGTGQSMPPRAPTTTASHGSERTPAIVDGGKEQPDDRRRQEAHGIGRRHADREQREEEIEDRAEVAAIARDIGHVAEADDEAADQRPDHGEEEDGAERPRPTPMPRAGAADLLLRRLGRGHMRPVGHRLVAHASAPLGRRPYQRQRAMMSEAIPPMKPTAARLTDADGGSMQGEAEPQRVGHGRGGAEEKRRGAERPPRPALRHEAGDGGRGPRPAAPS